MLESRFRFEVVVADHAGSPVHRERVEDLQPIFEDMLFAAVRAGVLPNDGRRCTVTLTPIWSERGAPRVGVISAQLGAVRKAYGLAVVADVLRAAAIERESIVAALEHEGHRLQWWLEAYPREEARDHHAPRFKVALGREPLPLLGAPFRAFGLAEPVLDADPVAVVIRRSVLEWQPPCSARFTRGSPARSTGRRCTWTSPRGG